MDDKWIFIDFDTLDLSEKAIILSVSIFKTGPHITDISNFKELASKVLYLRPSFDEQRGRVANREVLEKFKSSNVGNILDKENRKSLSECKEKILEYLKDEDFTHVFCRGFNDNKWWQEFVSLCQFEYDPLPFYKWREITTAFDIMFGNTKAIDRPNQTPSCSLTNVVCEYLTFATQI